jgi:competence protein ComEC
VHPSFLRRPLFLAVVAYMVLLAFLKSRGFFAVAAPPQARRWTRAPAVAVEGVALSGFAPKRPGDRIWLRAERVDGQACPPAKLMVYIARAADSPELRPGQRLRLTGRLRRPIWPRPGAKFDEKDFLAVRGAALVLHARRLEILEARVPILWKPWAAAEAAHRSLHDYLARAFEPECAALLEGFLLGYKGPIPPRLNRQIQDAGAMHLLVPSGAKVAFVLLFVWWLGERLGLGRRGRLAAAGAAGGFYVLAVGGEPPYTRAYLAALSLAASRLGDRDTAEASGLLLAAAATLLLRPAALFETGFQMTYLAALGLAIALPRWRPPRRWDRRLQAAATALLVSVVVQAMLWPVFAAVFRRGSLIGVLANILLVPASGLVMAGGFGAWAASFLPWSGPERLLAGAARGLVAAFRWTCAAFAGLPGAAVDLQPMPAWGIAAYYLAVLGFLLLPQFSINDLNKCSK